jgi:hypothetical protein
MPSKVTSKPSSKVSGGSGKMHGFTPVGSQASGVTAVTGKGGGKAPGAKIPAGPTGKIGAKQVGVQAQSPGRTGQR